MYSAKDNIREKARAYRGTLDDDDLARLNNSIYQNLIDDVDFSCVDNMHIYISSERLKEPDTNRFIKFVRVNYPKVRIYTSFVQNGQMYSAAIKKSTKFTENSFGISEPMPPSRPQGSIKYDLIIVPTLAFDIKNNRLGYGRGMYDKFLSSQKDSTKIGLCYKACQHITISTENHDIKLNKIITEVK